MSDKKNQAHLPLFIAVYKDGSKIEGKENYFETGWLELPLKQIKTLFYLLPTNDYLCLTGYNKYFHMIEATKGIMGKGKGIVKLQYAYIMAKKENEVISYRITLHKNKNDRYKTNDITVRIFKADDENITKLNSQNWR